MNSDIKKFFENKNNCTGCSACESICREQCIKMLPDFQGFLYPVVDEEKCVGCSRCIRVCPVK